MKSIASKCAGLAMLLLLVGGLLMFFQMTVYPPTPQSAAQPDKLLEVSAFFMLLGLVLTVVSAIAYKLKRN